MHVDPKAPADHPSHPSQIRAGGQEARLRALQRTGAEREAGIIPDRDELDRRLQLVAEYRDDPDPEYAPTLEDLTGVQHTWAGETSGWEPEIEPAAEGAGVAQESQQEGSEGETPEPPAEPEMAEESPQGEAPKRGRHRATSKRKAGKPQAPDLDQALANLDAAKGKK